MDTGTTTWLEEAKKNAGMLIVSVVLAIMIWRQFPLSGVWLVGTLVGINLLFSGITTISVAAAAKRAASSV